MTVLLYDHRTIGSSDGLPRNTADPFKQVEDYHDAVTFMQSQPRVDPNRIILWGLSMSGATALCAAALDKRVAAVIASSPATETEITAEKLEDVLSLAQRDRQSRMDGGPPLNVLVYDADGRFLFDMAPSVPLLGPNALRVWSSLGHGGGSQNSIETWYKMALWNPLKLMRLLAQTPVMICVGEHDPLCRFKDKDSILECFLKPKTLLLMSNKSHYDIWDGPEGEVMVEAQIDFVRELGFI